MSRRVPEGPPPAPVVQRVRIRYAKRGRLRFSSHRDFARAFERALRRAAVPMAYSGGFTPHPKISYLGAAPTGVASEAEYLEIGLADAVDLAALARTLDDALPEGLDIVEVVQVAATGAASLADRIQGSHWQVQLPGVTPEQARTAVEAFLAVSSYPIERVTKAGRKAVDGRAAVVSATVAIAPPGPAESQGPGDGPSDGNRAVEPGRAILDLVVRQVTPAVRPDDVLAALRGVAGLALAGPPVAVRVAQGPLDDTGAVGDPLREDRSMPEASP
ncbi:MAG TPA: TIGR03936 family radical SAM-associated protein [Jatrophihabitantaceae bacterium]